VKSGSNLEKVLESGQFVVTAELGPPKSADRKVVEKKAGILKGYADAVNITDNQTAVVRMSSIGVGTMLVPIGLEPIIQMTCRDRNRIAIQSDLLGAYALGMRNLLCLTGDHQSFGNHPGSKNVFDIDSIQLIQIVKGMRDEKKFQCGEEIAVEPRFFIGAAENPFAAPFDFRATRLAKKANAGVDFIQTQLIYNVPKFSRWMEEVYDRGLHERVKILAGVGPIKSPAVARYMRDKVPGLDVPNEIVERMEGAGKGIEDKKARGEAWRKEGMQLCVDIINQVRQIPGVAGIHIMAVEWEEAVPEIVQMAGLYPRPQL